MSRFLCEGRVVNLEFTVTGTLVKNFLLVTSLDELLFKIYINKTVFGFVIVSYCYVVTTWAGHGFA